MKKWHLAILLAGLLSLLILKAPLGSQTTIAPSKSDQILKKLDEVLSNQKDFKERLSRIEHALGVKGKNEQKGSDKQSGSAAPVRDPK